MTPKKQRKARTWKRWAVVWPNGSIDIKNKAPTLGQVCLAQRIGLEEIQILITEILKKEKGE